MFLYVVYFIWTLFSIFHHTDKLLVSHTVVFVALTKGLSVQKTNEKKKNHLNAVLHCFNVCICCWYFSVFCFVIFEGTFSKHH